MREIASLMAEPILALTGVAAGYAGAMAVSGVSFAMRPGEFVGVFGPNGAGKSTLIKGILGLVSVLAGEIKLLGRSGHELRRARTEIGYVPQRMKSDVSFPASTTEVVMMGLYGRIGWIRRPQAVHWQRVRACLDLVGMADCAGRAFAELSGGQQQRTLIARALVAEPKLLVLDEPATAVDIYAQYSILETIARLHEEEGLSVLVVSHDINEIVHLCDKVLLLNGKMIGYGPPVQVLTRENLRAVYGDRVFVYDHQGHPHVLVGDFHA